jgi:murein DD-endopeptidase MepM/ murein hydrolase activator NlpD
VEALYTEGEFTSYGNILAAEFTNNGQLHTAFRFKADGQKGRANYYNEKGQALRKTLLKAPLNYRRISSTFTKRRFHPILRTYRPHLGVDYAAARGTPVSSVGDGVVEFAGRKGANGKLIIIKHAAGYKTYYGHLHKIARGIRKGKRVTQGQFIGTVGSTGRSTGPHLDYRVKRHNKSLNPLRLKLPRNTAVKKEKMEEFATLIELMDTRLAAIVTPVVPSKERHASR